MRPDSISCNCGIDANTYKLPLLHELTATAKHTGLLMTSYNQDRFKFCREHSYTSSSLHLKYAIMLKQESVQYLRRLS